MIKKRILYIYPDTLGLSAEPLKNPLYYLSSYLTGDYLAVWWITSAADARERARQIRRAVPEFQFHWTRSYRLPPVARHLWDLLFYVGKGWQLCRKRGGYDAIVAYGPFRTALAGWLIKCVTGTPLIVELPGNPHRLLQFAKGPLAGLKRKLAPAIVSFILKQADHVRLLYPDQLDGFENPGAAHISVFHDFVAVKAVPRSSQPGQYVFFLGYPWLLKGVDVLIRAFNLISAEFPEVKLKIVGHCPDRTPFEELRAGNENIEFQRGVYHDEALQLMAGCRFFVLPSRTEAMGRVLLEAMAAEKPIIASRVDGIPHYVKDGETGLLFESENVAELATCMRRLLQEPDLAAALAHRGHQYVRTVLSEEEYARHFTEMVDAVQASVGRPRRS